ncbi:UDP-glucose 4-epimerase GalE [Candidatus Mycoplasma pogonae]
MNTYLLIGGAGYIGSQIALQLLDKKQNIIILDNFSTGNQHDFFNNIKIYKGNSQDLDLLIKIFSENKIDVVINLAASIFVGDSVNQPLEYYENNVLGPLQVLKVMEKFKVKNIIFSSTAAVYGEPKNDQAIAITASLQPINPYGWSKLFAEQIIRDCSKAYSLKYAILRYFNVAGADIKARNGFIFSSRKPLKHLIPVITYKALNQESINIFGNDYPTPDGTCIRDYVHVSDLATAHIDAAQILLDEQNKNFEINIGSQIGYSNQEVIATFEKVLKQKLDVTYTAARPGDPSKLVADISEAQKIINYSPKYDLEAIIATEIKWTKKLLKTKNS